MGCLVTEKKEPAPQTECPPSIETAVFDPPPPNPLNEVIRVDVSGGGSGDTGPGGGELVFEYQVRDCNETQDLEAKVFASTSERPIRSFIIDHEVRNPSSFSLPVSAFASFAGTCQRLELLVSGRFRFGTDQERVPVEDGDLGTATWWLAVTDTENPGVEMALCPR